MVRASRVLAAVPVSALLLIGAAPVAAVDLHKSRLSTIELGKCRQIRKHRDGGAWLCPGLAGWPVYLAEGDQRQMLAFGPNPRARTSATQSLGAFNTVLEGRRRPTIEWRVELDGKGRPVPYATIVRFRTSRDGETGEVLVVTKVDAKDSCRLAVIDARANADAMAVARAWAVSEARRRPCPDAPEVLGTPGQSPL